VTAWIVRIAPAFEAWLLRLSEIDQERVVAAIEVLEESGPWDEPSPLSDRISGRHWISVRGGEITIGYRLDPYEDAVMLLHGHEEGDRGWQAQFADMLGASLDQLDLLTTHRRQ